MKSTSVRVRLLKIIKGTYRSLFILTASHGVALLEDGVHYTTDTERRFDYVGSECFTLTTKK